MKPRFIKMWKIPEEMHKEINKIGKEDFPNIFADQFEAKIMNKMTDTIIEENVYSILVVKKQ